MDRHGFVLGLAGWGGEPCATRPPCEKRVRYADIEHLSGTTMRLAVAVANGTAPLVAVNRRELAWHASIPGARIDMPVGVL